jgi:hypothetical protein
VLATDLAAALDPVAFVTTALALPPDPWQAALLRCTAPQIAVLGSRQTGKSTAVAALALHQACYMPESLVLLVSPSLRQSSELARKIHGLLGRLDPRPVLLEENKLSLTLPNASRIVSLPASESTVRGYSGPALVIEDEAARCDDDLFTAISPMLATSNGRLVLLSTPYGQRGHFYQFWTEGASWERFTARAVDCPRISPDFLARERATLGQGAYQQEYELEFLAPDDAAFSWDAIQRMTTDDAPLWTADELALPVDVHHQRAGEVVRYG